MEHRFLPDPTSSERMTSDQLRSHFLVTHLFKKGRVSLVYVDADRMITGSIVPTTDRLTLPGEPHSKCESLLSRREMGILNLGSPGIVHVEGQRHMLSERDSLYIGRNAGSVDFESERSDSPAKFFVASFPAHCEHPTVLIPAAQTAKIELGENDPVKRRTIQKSIHEEAVDACQLTMGITCLHEGSVWNTMPCHTHLRRMEAYLYFDLPDDEVVFHFMGRPDRTHHIVVQNFNLVLSPSWSIHCGCGTSSYSFAWAMGGENRDFSDMNPVPTSSLR